MTKMTHTAQAFANTQVGSVDCVALAREARAHAQAFRDRVRAFDKINIGGIFTELNAMRQSCGAER